MVETKVPVPESLRIVDLRVGKGDAGEKVPVSRSYGDKSLDECNRSVLL